MRTGSIEINPFEQNAPPGVWEQGKLPGQNSVIMEWWARLNLNDEQNERLETILYRVNRSEISSIKSIVAGIIKIIHDPDATIRDLKEIVEIDPPLTAKVLMVANSAFYSPRTRIGDIKSALVWIGLDALREVALRQKVCQIFKGNGSIEGYSRKRLWKHSIAVALLSKMIYRREFGMSGADAYVAGLLHDIGLIVEDQFMPNDFKKVLKKARKEKKHLTSAEDEVFGFNHGHIGMAIAANWRLPEELSVAIGYHDVPLTADPKFIRLASTLYMAEYYCQQNNLGYSDTYIQNPEVVQKCLENLNVKQNALELIVEDVKKDLSRMERLGLFKNG